MYQPEPLVPGQAEWSFFNGADLQDSTSEVPVFGAYLCGADPGGSVWMTCHLLVLTSETPALREPAANEHASEHHSWIWPIFAAPTLKTRILKPPIQSRVQIFHTARISKR